MTDASWVEHPDVIKYIRMAVAKRLKQKPDFLTRNGHIDRESIIQYLWGECGRSKFDPIKSKHGTFAYRVAYTRFGDITRNANNKIGSYQQKNEDDKPKQRISEDEETTLCEMASGIYRTVKDKCDQMQPKRGRGRPGLPLASLVAITMFMERMRWGCRLMARMTERYPSILESVGVAQSRHYSFFSRRRRGVALFARKQKKLLVPETALTESLALAL